MDETNPEQDDDKRKKDYFDELRAQKQAYVDKVICGYKRRVPKFRWLFWITGALAITASVSLPFLAQTTTEANKIVLSSVSLGVALLTALNSFFGWRLTWQKGVGAIAALEHYSACWEIDLVKASRENYDKAKHDAYLHTSYLFTQVLAVVSAESEAFFAELRPLPSESKEQIEHPISPASQ